MMSNLVNREHSLYDNNLSFWCLSFSTWSVQFSSVAQSCLTLCDPMDAACQTSLSITNSQSLLRLLHIESVGDVIQPSHPLSSPSPPVFNLSQHQGLFQWVSSSPQVAKVLELQLQHQSFQWIFRTDFLQDGLVWSPCRPRDSQESSPTPQFKSVNSSVLSFLHSPSLTSILLLLLLLSHFSRVRLCATP